MPMLHNENFTPGDWVAEVYARCYSPKPPGVRFRWMRYSRPAHHIHPNIGYEFDYLARNLKAAAPDARGVLRMRNRKTGDIIMAAIL